MNRRQASALVLLALLLGVFLFSPALLANLELAAGPVLLLIAIVFLTLPPEPAEPLLIPIPTRQPRRRGPPSNSLSR